MKKQKPKEYRPTGYSSKDMLNPLSSYTRWTGDYATGRVFGPTDAENPRLVGFNRRDFNFILEAVNKALKPVAKPVAPDS